MPTYQFGDSVFFGSVFDVREIYKLTIPFDLRLAVELIVQASSLRGGTVLCVARPEMFTHGRSLNWLRDKLGGATDHLSLSDGATAKLIPGMRNHLFTYGLQSKDRKADFKMLMRRAPELLQQFHTQINSFHRFVAGGAVVEPKPLALMLKSPLPSKLVWFYSFYLNPHSVDESVNYMMSWGGLDENKLAGFQRVTYIPLTEIASSDVAFQRVLCDRISAVFFDPTSCLVMRLPLPGKDLSVRMAVALQGIQSARAQLPRARAANIFFVADDVSEQTLAPLADRTDWVVHHSVEYWRYTQSIYRNAAKIFLFQDRRRPTLYESAKHFYVESFVQAPEVITPNPADEDSSLFEALQ